jgi:hypothetical protein
VEVSNSRLVNGFDHAIALARFAARAPFVGKHEATMLPVINDFGSLMSEGRGYMYAAQR